MNFDEVSVVTSGLVGVWGLGCQSVCDGCTCCTWWNWDIWDRPSTLGLTRPPQDKIWLSSEHGCLVTEINDFSHAVSSPSSCLSSPFPELSIIVVGLYFTFLPIPSTALTALTALLLLLFYPTYVKLFMKIKSDSARYNIQREWDQRHSWLYLLKIMLFKSVKNQELKVCKIWKVLISF